MPTSETSVKSSSWFGKRLKGRRKDSIVLVLPGGHIHSYDEEITAAEVLLVFRDHTIVMADKCGPIDAALGLDSVLELGQTYFVVPPSTYNKARGPKRAVSARYAEKNSKVPQKIRSSSMSRIEDLESSEYSSFEPAPVPSLHPRIASLQVIIPGVSSDCSSSESGSPASVISQGSTGPCSPTLLSSDGNRSALAQHLYGAEMAERLQRMTEDRAGGVSTPGLPVDIERSSIDALEGSNLRESDAESDTSGVADPNRQPPGEDSVLLDAKERILLAAVEAELAKFGRLSPESLTSESKGGKRRARMRRFLGHLGKAHAKANLPPGDDDECSSVSDVGSTVPNCPNTPESREARGPAVTDKQGHERKGQNAVDQEAESVEGEDVDYALALFEMQLKQFESGGSGAANAAKLIARWCPKLDIVFEDETDMGEELLDSPDKPDSPALE
eukprot:TRINITY_DN15010_c0_g1_i1.p1 TRINITY_DN15010_c0_g1~~TRINITY_DN15010_c0_g1_i1.p1  ORF type:complete len:445 (+),score=80.45 TRINITY_DN15010_c0_g1_i1:441-1775(+)